MKIWKDEEVKSLFKEVEKCKKENKPLREAFAAHAARFGRKTNSVRNYYYADVENLTADVERAKRLGVNVSDYEKKHFVAFDKAAEEELFENVKDLVGQGMSVRSACLKLSGGNLTEMTRIQNKYQNMVRKIEKTNNVVPFRPNFVTESEINSLFQGLVRLVKKSAEEEAKENSRFSSKELERLESELIQLKHENVLLRKENEHLKTILSDKRESLGNHIKMVQTQKNS